MMEDTLSDEIYWIVVAGFIFAFILAFGIGANDVANSFGTSVGSKVLTLGQACILATIFEIAGAVLIGYKVSDTMRKGILDVSLYEGGGEKQLAAGCLSALIAGSVWLIAATAMGLPVSGTHSVVGATVGFTLTAKGTAGIRWSTLGAIVLSWFLSPVLSGTASAALYWLIKKLILTSEHPVQAGLLSLPFFYGCTVLVNILSVAMDGPKMLHMDKTPFWLALLCSALLGLAVGVLVQLVVVPHWKRTLLGVVQDLNKNVNFTVGPSNDTTPTNTPIHLTNSSEKSHRPTSLISDDGRQVLQSITETAEMVSLSDADKSANRALENMNRLATYSPALAQNGVHDMMNARNRALLATMDDCSILSKSLSPPHGLRRDILDSKLRSLNNVDLTVTSLKYIDETLSNSKSIDSTQLCGMGNSYDSNQSYLKNSNDTIQRLEAPRHLTQLFYPAMEPGKTGMESDRSGNVTNMYMRPAESVTSLDGTVVNPMVTPNSSAAPLIMSCNSRTVEDEDRGKEGGVAPVPEGVLKLFSFLQVLTAAFGSFAHGGNDVSNAIGPLIALWLLYTDGAAHASAETPLGILVFGGVGIAIGLWLWGRKVIKTVGEDLTSITPDTGFTIEIGAALTVLVASKVGLPVSTTHCKVGSVVFVGAISKQEKGVDWKLFRNIIYAWIVTVPIVASVSSFFMYLFNITLIN